MNVVILFVIVVEFDTMITSVDMILDKLEIQKVRTENLMRKLGHGKERETFR